MIILTCSLFIIFYCIGLVNDTKNTNTGFKGGVCAKYESKIKKELLRLSCRHHVLEIVLKRVCEKLLGDSATPNFTFNGSEQIKIQWNNIDKSQYLPIDEEDIPELLSVFRDQSIEQIENDARNSFVRDDYAELNDICLKLLGVRTTKKILVLGALSKARWMAKAILIGKMYLLRDQLELDDEILISLRRLSIFICHVFVKFWNRAPNAINAPVNDLLLMQQLHLYREHDFEISQAAINSFKDHLWYLGAELITLSLFSSNVTVETKNKMRHKFQEEMGIREEDSLRFKVNESVEFDRISLEDFVKPRSFLLFTLLGITPDFLHRDATIWDHIESYNKIKSIVEQTIIVTNDGVERMLGIAAKSITNQRARKEKNFENLILSKFDENSRRTHK